jgi:nitric oxide dioxygenase
MTNLLSAETIALVRASVPALEAHGADITAAMYKRLFRDDHIRALFNHSNHGENGAQTHALAAAILAYARNIENLGALAPVVERIAQKHIGYHILPEHYPYVATALLEAIKEVLGDAADEKLLAAWGEAYWFLANIFKAREVVLRDEIERTDGGWNGWRAFRVDQKIRESSAITSFVLRPVDGKPVIAHRAGQYLTLLLERIGAGELRRNYSISCAANGETYRISVKREAHGEASRWLHDHVTVGAIVRSTPPAGDFFLAEQPPRPVVLLSGGVGLTPMVSMIETIAKSHPDLETHYIHGTISSDTHAMDIHVRDLSADHPKMQVVTFYSDPIEQDVPGETHDVTGMITTDWLRENVPMDNADFYLCGPKPFLRAFVGGLSLAGVAADRIHYEFFGPADALMAA